MDGMYDFFEHVHLEIKSLVSLTFVLLSSKSKLTKL